MSSLEPPAPIGNQTAVTFLKLMMMVFIRHRNSILNLEINLPIPCNCFKIAMIKTISTAVFFGYLALH